MLNAQSEQFTKEKFKVRIMDLEKEINVSKLPVMVTFHHLGLLKNCL